MPPPDRSAGFTLLEMLVVLTILGLVGALVAANAPGRSAALDMRSAAATVAGTLRLARTRAIATNQPTTVQFDSVHATLSMDRDPVRVLPPGIAMVLATMRGPGTAIEFRPDGSSTGGIVALSGRGQGARIEVGWLTGRVGVAPGS